MPFLRDFVGGAVRAPLRSVMPALTPPGWTSLMTGQKPGQHGVFDFFQKGVGRQRVFPAVQRRRHPRPTRSGRLASAYGKRVLVAELPADVPAACRRWLRRPGRLDAVAAAPVRLPSARTVRPAQGAAELQPASELSLDMALEAKAIEGCPDEEYADWIALHIRRERRWVEILRTSLLKTHRPSLVGVVFDGVDKLQHLCWRFLDPSCRPEQPTEWEAQITRALRGVLHPA